MASSPIRPVPPVRISSLRHTPSHDHNGHVVQLYTDDGFLIDVLDRFIGGALAAGNAAVLVATEAHREELEKRLTARGVNFAKAAQSGRYIALDAKQTLTAVMVQDVVDGARFEDVIGAALGPARAHGDGKTAVFGELVALLWTEGKPQEALRVEQLWNRLVRKHAFSLLCAYPLNGFDNERDIKPFLEMCAQHTGVVPSESYVGLRNDEDRLRSVAQLEQRTQVLEKQLARRKGEEQFRLLVEAVQDYAIFLLDPKGHVSSWNLGAARIKQYKASEIIGKHFSCFYEEEDKRKGKPDWELMVAARDGRLEDEGWRLRKDGSRFWAIVIITAVRDASGELVGFAKVTRDATEAMQVRQSLQKEVAERREAQQQLLNSEKTLRQLSLHLLRTQDEERRRIGRDLHDSLSQYLTVLKIKLDSLSARSTSSTVAPDGVEECIGLVADCIREVRTVSYLLHPPLLEEMGLKSAIPWYLEGFSARSGIESTLEIQPEVDRLPRDSELALFRVLQEGLTNIHRHSGSQTAQVRLALKDGFAVLEIEDKGKGVPAQLLEQSGRNWSDSHGVGLRGMSERVRQLGGRLELVSDQSGTKVTASVPIVDTLSASPDSD